MVPKTEMAIQIFCNSASSSNGLISSLYPSLKPYHLISSFCLFLSATRSADSEMAGGNHKRFPAFFQLYESEYLSERMPIPGSFLHCLNGAIPKKTVLRNNLGHRWGVEVKRTEQGTFFQEGWKQFCEAHSMKNGEFLVFQYNGEVFDYRVFGHSMCEKTLPPPPQEEREELHAVKEESEEEDIEMEVKEHKDDGGGGGEAGEEVDDEEDDDDYDDHHDGAAHMPPIYPYFEARLIPGTPRNKLRAPIDLIKDNNIELAGTVFFQDPLGRKWDGKVSIWGDGSIWIGGWKRFCTKNNVEQGDLCICEFMLDNQGHRCTGYDCIHRCDTIKVRIIREVY